MATELSPDEILAAVAALSGNQFVQLCITEAARLKAEKLLQDKGSENGAANRSPISMVPAEPEVG